MGLLHSSRGRRALPGRLGSELLPGRLSSGGFTRSLLGTCHLVVLAKNVTKPAEFKTKSPKLPVKTRQVTTLMR